MLNRLPESRAQNQVFDDEVGDRHRFASLRHQVAQHIVVRRVAAQPFESTHALERRLAHRRRRPQCEAHAFQHLGHQHARCHFDRHSQRLQPLAKAAINRNPAIEAEGRAHCGVPERRNHRAQILRPHGNVGVCRHQQIVPRRLRHQVHRITARIHPRRLAGVEIRHRDVRIARRQLARHRQARVILAPCAEDQLILRIVELEIAFQALFQMGRRAVQRLQNADRRSEVERLPSSPAPGSQIFPGRDKGHRGKNRGGQDSGCT